MLPVVFTVLLPVLLLGGACTGDPADVTGLYTTAITNRENGCNFNDWQEGDTTTGIQITVTQSGASAEALVGGAAGVWMNVSLGSNEYAGTVSGDQVYLTLHGTKSATVGNCTWTINSTLTATLTGDVLAGDIRYSPATNGSPDCASIEGCVSRQEFNGVRAP